MPETELKSRNAWWMMSRKSSSLKSYSISYATKNFYLFARFTNLNVNGVSCTGDDACVRVSGDMKSCPKKTTSCPIDDENEASDIEFECSFNDS